MPECWLLEADIWVSGLIQPKDGKPVQMTRCATLTKTCRCDWYDTAAWEFRQAQQPALTAKCGPSETAVRSLVLTLLWDSCGQDVLAHVAVEVVLLPGQPKDGVESWQEFACLALFAGS